MHSEPAKTRIRRKRRSQRVRSNLAHTQRIRISIHRSINNLYAQLIDDKEGKTLFGISTKDKELASITQKTKAAEALGEKFAKLCIEKGIAKLVFDRGSYKYHGRIKAFTEPIRQQNLLA